MCRSFILLAKIMPGGPESFLIENILRKSDDTNERSTMDISALESFNDVACNPHKPPSDKEHTKDNSSSNSGSTNLSPPQPGSYRSESSEESPALKFSTESIMMSSPDIKRNHDYLFPIDESVSPPNQLTFPWLHLPPVLSGFYQGGLTATPSAHFPSPPTPNDDERGEIIEYSPHDFGSTPTQENRPKRARITFSPYQVKVLRAKYNHKKYLSNAERSELAGDLGLSDQQVKIWFQNQRYKEKKRLDREKENAFSQTNFDPPLRMQPLSPLSPLSPLRSGFLNNRRDNHSLPFSFPPPPPPPPQFLAQIISRAYSHTAQFAGMMTAQPNSMDPSQDTSYQQEQEKDKPGTSKS
ncbi:unnamed protein product [Rodentolepis nana]|uniref:Homeobox domain-containing protein n=1 Tax=Rodentolepis nana TaxID=102285 RepID=A0A0R3TVJ0_RODNA|nr:unnamed protein product [Rodentolepis nana]